MSCHDIGRGMNSVCKVVIDLYEQGRITKDAAICIINACRKGVYWCDGNEGEAVEILVDMGYCGLCFEKVDELYNVYENEFEYPLNYNVFRAFDKTAAHYCLCKNCKQKVIEKFKADNTNSFKSDCFL